MAPQESPTDRHHREWAEALAEQGYVPPSSGLRNHGPLDTARLKGWAIGMARHVALLSKDPSTQVGAVIFDAKRRLVSAGYNGFARGVPDTPELLEDRTVKYRLILHAEKNAIMFATAPLDGCTMVVTHPCCAQCAALIVQSGIKHVLWPTPSAAFLERWREDLELARMQFEHAGVTVHELVLGDQRVVEE